MNPWPIILGGLAVVLLAGAAASPSNPGGGSRTWWYRVVGGLDANSPPFAVWIISNEVLVATPNAAGERVGGTFLTAKAEIMKRAGIPRKWGT